MNIYEINKGKKIYTRYQSFKQISEDFERQERRQRQIARETARRLLNAYREERIFVENAGRRAFPLDGLTNERFVNEEELSHFRTLIIALVGSSSGYKLFQNFIQRQAFRVVRGTEQDFRRVYSRTVRPDPDFNTRITSLVGDNVNIFTETTQRRIIDETERFRIRGFVDKQEIVDSLLKTYDTSRGRIETTARTITNNVSTRARHHSYQQFPELTHIQWISTLDQDVRVSHLQVHGTIIRIGDSFPIGVFPGEPPNCRCIDIALEMEDVVRNADGSFEIREDALEELSGATQREARLLEEEIASGNI